MGVVRREGPWRLEKRRDGVYEITYERDLQERILTPDADRNPDPGMNIEAVPVHRVNSFDEAVGRFEERAYGQDPMDSISPISQPRTTSTDQQDPISEDLSSFDDLNLEDTPPGVLAGAFIVVGGIFIWTDGLQPGSWIFRFGILFLTAGLLIITWVFATTDDIEEAIELLTTTPAANSSSSPAEASDVEKAPPVPDALRDELIFERADHQCEWCGDHTNHPEVHHITPRSDGGTNERTNLIVLCPNHHRQADNNGLPKSRLRKTARRQETDQ